MLTPIKYDKIRPLIKTKVFLNSLLLANIMDRNQKAISPHSIKKLPEQGHEIPPTEYQVIHGLQKAFHSKRHHSTFENSGTKLPKLWNMKWGKESKLEFKKWRQLEAKFFDSMNQIRIHSSLDFSSTTKTTENWPKLIGRKCSCVWTEINSEPKWFIFLYVLMKGAQKDQASFGPLFVLFCLVSWQQLQING